MYKYYKRNDYLINNLNIIATIKREGDESFDEGQDVLETVRMQHF